MRDFSNSSLTACPPPGRPACRRAVPDPAHAAPDLRPGRRRGHSARCPKTAPPEPDPVGIRLRNAPESALVFQCTTQVPNEATLRAIRTTATAAQVLVIVDRAVLHRALQLDDGTVPVREVRSLSLPAGPEMAGSIPPAVVNLCAACVTRQGSGTSGGTADLRTLLGRCRALAPVASAVRCARVRQPHALVMPSSELGETENHCDRLQVADFKDSGRRSGIWTTTRGNTK